MTQRLGGAPPAPFALRGRVALVTGAAGFLGREHCDALADAGADVVAVDLDEAAAQAVARDVAARRGTRTLGVGADIASEAAVRGLGARTLAEFGRVDVLVNNAQLQLRSSLVPFERQPVEDFRRILDVNVTGAFLCAQTFGAAMREHGRGSIINFGSIYGMIGPDFRIYEGTEFTTAAVYSASKAAIYGLTRYLATYWGPHGIRVNAVTPGGIFNGHADPFLGAYNARVPMRRMGEAQELRGVIQFLASDASSYVTGQNIPVDGGRTAW